MRSNLPVTRQIAWISLVPHLVVMGLITLIFYSAGAGDFLIYGVSAYLLLSFSLRKIIPADHNNGIGKIHEKQFEEAIHCFQRSYDFFCKNEWVDKFRYLALLSSSKMCYREMALCNIAFCYSQLGEADKALEYYNRTVAGFPSNEIAISALRFINSVKKD